MENTAALPDLQTPRGKVVTIGQVKTPRTPVGYEIPVLHFIVIQKDDGGYVATCIHLQIDGYGPSIGEACDDMASNVGYFLHENFKYPERIESAWDNIRDLFESNPRSELLWDKYRMLQVEFAKKGITTDRSAYLYEKIYALLEENRKLRAELSEKQSLISWSLDALISDIKDTMTLDCPKGIA